MENDNGASFLSPSRPHLGVCCSSEAGYSGASEGGGCVQLLHPPGLCLPARVREQVEYPRLRMEALNRQNVVQTLGEVGGRGGGRKEGRKGGREGGRKKLKGRKEEGGRIQKSFNLEGEVETVVSSEYFGCFAHISTWFCVLRFHTRMVASRDPLRMVGPQG